MQWSKTHVVLEVPTTIGPYTSMRSFKCMTVVHFGGFRFRTCWFWGICVPYLLSLQGTGRAGLCTSCKSCGPIQSSWNGSLWFVSTSCRLVQFKATWFEWIWTQGSGFMLATRTLLLINSKGTQEFHKLSYLPCRLSVRSAQDWKVGFVVQLISASS